MASVLSGAVFFIRSQKISPCDADSRKFAFVK